MKVLITSPSLDLRTNVSGISALTGPLLKNFSAEFFQLNAGTSDQDKGTVKRLRSLLCTIFSMFIYRFKHKIKILHINTAANTMSLIRDSILAAIAKITFLPFVTHFHGGDWLTSHSCPTYLKLLVRFLCNSAETCIVLGNEEVGVLQNKFGVKRKIEVLANYVEPDIFKAPAGVNRDSGCLLFLGRLVQSKSVDRLCELFLMINKRLPDIQLKICGDGPLREELLAEFGKIPKDNWEYCGVVYGEQKRNLLHSSDIFILPSISGEGMPVAMLEAMAAGCIPVVTRLGAISSIIRDTENGSLAVPGDIGEFADKVVTILTNTNKEEIRETSKSDAKAYSIEVYKDNLDKIYECVFSSNS